MFEIQSTVCVPLYAAACMFSTPFSTAVYIAVRLVLQIIDAVNAKSFHFLIFQNGKKTPKISYLVVVFHELV